MQPHQKLLARIHRTISRSRTGAKLTLAVRNQCNAIFARLLNDGIEQRTNGELSVIRAVAPTSVLAIDVGANNGQWTELFLRNAGTNTRMILFEPGALAGATLNTKFQNNELIEIIPAAVSDQSGWVTFYEAASSGNTETSSAIEAHARRFNKDIRAVEVRCVTISDICRERSITTIDFIKIDTEGFDLKVIKGFVDMISTHSIGFIQFEYNLPWAPAGSTLAEALKIFQDHNYLTLLIKRDGLYSFEYEQIGEVSSLLNVLAVAPNRLASIAPMRRGNLFA